MTSERRCNHGVLQAIASVVAVLMAASIPKASIPPAEAITHLPTAGAETLFFDDFAGLELDRSKWNVIVTGHTVNNEQQAYVDSRDTVAIVRGREADGARNGALVIRARHRPGFVTPEERGFDFVSGRLDTRTKFEFNRGTAAARVKLSAGPGLWPAFWVLGAGRWPDAGEMDIMENVGDPAWTNFAVHGPGYSGSTPLTRRKYFGAGNDVTKWHVYAMSWTDDALAFSIDGQEEYRVTRAMVERHGRWVFDTPKFLVINLAVGGAYPLAINHATEPYIGMPQTTVDLVKRGDGVMIVDWVRVTRDKS
jgi:beta-glucanase (GH16 family)